MMNILWFIPTHGDGRYLGSSKGARQADYPYFKQIAQAADQLGYTGSCCLLVDLVKIHG